MGLRDFFGKISDAIPNEITKTNSLTSWIPYLGIATRALSAVDNFGETYSNDGSLVDSIQHGVSGGMGTSADPNYYSPKNQGGLSNDWGDDWSLNLGKMGNIYKGYKSGGTGSGASSLGGIMDLFTKSGNESGETVFGMDTGSSNSSGRYSGKGSGNNLDVGSILNLASSLSSMFGSSGGSSSSSSPNLEFADGSGRYLEGNSPSSSGSFIDGNFIGSIGGDGQSGQGFDLSSIIGMFGQGGGMTTQMPSGGMDMNSFDWSNILKMLGSSGMGQGSEAQSQPSMGMIPRLPAMMPQVQTSPTRGEGYYQTWLRQNNLG